jgi:hypothetical protein
MSRLTLPLLILAACSLATSGCRSIRTDIQTPAGPLQAGPHSYRWIETPSGTMGAPEGTAETVHAEVTDAVDATLATKGWQQQQGTVDLLLDYTVRITPATRKERPENEDYVSGLQFSRASGWKAAPAGAEETVLLYDEGTLGIHMADPTGKTIWLGSAAVELHHDGSPRDGKLINRVVERLLRSL